MSCCFPCRNIFLEHFSLRCPAIFGTRMGDSKRNKVKKSIWQLLCGCSSPQTNDWFRVKCMRARSFDIARSFCVDQSVVVSWQVLISCFIHVMSGPSAIWFNLFVVLFVVLCVVHLCFEKKGGCKSHVLFHILGKKSCLVIKGWYAPLQLFVAVKTYVNTWTIILLQIFQYQQDQLAKAKKKRGNEN